MQTTASIRSFFDEATSTATHVVACASTRRAAIVDSVLDYDAKAGRTSTSSADAVVEHVRSEGLTVDWHLETHAQADHLSAAPYLQQALGGRIAIGEHIREVQGVFAKIFNLKDLACDGRPFDRLFADGDVFRIGDLEARVMHVPGHTPACVAYVVGEDVFVGDTLFMSDYGTARCDFPGGDARALYRSIRRLLDLPGSTRMHLCHDYRPGGREVSLSCTVDQQRAANIHVHDGVSEDAFVAMRVGRDRTLDIPQLMLPAVQVNIRAGHLPPPDDNGRRYLKIAINVL